MKKKTEEKNPETEEIEMPVQEEPENEVKPETAEDAEKKEAKAKKKKKAGRTEKPVWVNYEKDEIEKLIVKLSQKGHMQSEIGMILRDQYGIPDIKAFGLTVGKVLKSNSLSSEIPEDLYNLIKKAVLMHNHLQSNKKDKRGIHTLQLVESRLRKLGRYYSKIGKLPKNWKYDIEKAKLLVK